MSDKGARDHITLPFLIMYGFTGKGNDFFFSAQNWTHFNCISVYVNQSEIAQDLKQIQNKVFCFAQHSPAVLLLFVCSLFVRFDCSLDWEEE